MVAWKERALGHFYTKLRRIKILQANVIDPDIYTGTFLFARISATCQGARHGVVGSRVGRSVWHIG